MITDREGKLLSKKPRKGRISRRKLWSTPSNTPELWQGKNDKCPLVIQKPPRTLVKKIQGMKKNDTTAEWITDESKFYLLCLFKIIEQAEDIKLHLGRRLQDEQVEEKAQLIAQSPWGSQRKRNLLKVGSMDWILSSTIRNAEFRSHHRPAYWIKFCILAWNQVISMNFKAWHALIWSWALFYWKEKGGWCL